MANVLIISQTNMFYGAEFALLDYLENNLIHNIYLYTNSIHSISFNYNRYLSNDKIYLSKTMRISGLRRETHLFFYDCFINLYQIDKIVKAHSIEILYGNSSGDLMLLTLYKKLINRQIKTISHIHDIFHEEIGRPAFFLKQFSKIIDRIIVPSIAAKNSIHQYMDNINKVEVVYNGIKMPTKKYHDDDLKRYKNKYGLPYDKKIICFVGRIDRNKRLDLFIDSLIELNKINTDFFGIVIGKAIEPILLEMMFEKITKFDLPIKYIGLIERKELIECVYPIIDFLIITSNSESLSNIALEAMSQKKCVISRNIDALNEIIENNKTGFFFEYDAKPAKIGRNICSILRMQFENLQLIGENAFIQVNNKFSQVQKQEKINEIIKEVSRS